MPNQNDKQKNADSAANGVSRRGLLKSAAIASGLVTLGVHASAQEKEQRQLPLRQTGGAKPIADRLKTSDTALKKRARSDYQRSLKRYGGRFSNPIRQLFVTAQEKCCPQFGVVIIGSGYGASICAARLSQMLRPDQRICMIERGREWVPGTFPDRTVDVFKNTRNALAGRAKGQLNNPLGLYNVMMNDEVNVLTGNGLGGGSLVNASIALRPNHEVFEQKEWPKALRDVSVLNPKIDSSRTGGSSVIGR